MDGSQPTRVTPRCITCFQHGGAWPVEATRILTHTDGTKHRHAFAICGGRYGITSQHEFGVWLWSAE